MHTGLYIDGHPVHIHDGGVLTVPGVDIGSDRSFASLEAIYERYKSEKAEKAEKARARRRADKAAPLAPPPGDRKYYVLNRGELEEVVYRGRSTRNTRNPYLITYTSGAKDQVGSLIALTDAERVEFLAAVAETSEISKRLEKIYEEYSVADGITYNYVREEKVVVKTDPLRLAVFEEKSREEISSYPLSIDDERFFVAEVNGVAVRQANTWALLTQVREILGPDYGVQVMVLDDNYGVLSAGVPYLGSKNAHADPLGKSSYEIKIYRDGFPLEEAKELTERTEAARAVMNSYRLRSVA